MLTCDKRNAIATLHRQHPNHFMGKFFLDRETWIRDAQDRARRLDLDRSPTLSIFDIGCGVPYFLKACADLGHVVDGLDVSDETLQEASRIVMGKAYHDYVIHDTDLPSPMHGRTFDLVTMFGVNIRRRDGEWWSWDEWATFVGNVMFSVARGGRFVIQPNMGPHCSELLLDVDRWSSEIAPDEVSISGIWLTFTRK